jgi:hypothetical protein
MIGIKANRRKANKEEAEKPFWISFSDLMTALMVLFLVAMAVALIAVTHGLATIGEEAKKRDEAIASCRAEVNLLTEKAEFKGVTFRGNTIDFGRLATFSLNQHAFESVEHEKFVRKFVPQVLALTRSEMCSLWLKRIVVEGFASREGQAGYLYNLNLSYLRSQRVLCALLDSKAVDAMDEGDRRLVQTLFLVGGSSFKSSTGKSEDDRRVELTLEFRDIDKENEMPAEIPLDPGLKCPNDLR